MIDSPNDAAREEMRRLKAGLAGQGTGAGRSRPPDRRDDSGAGVAARIAQPATGRTRLPRGPRAIARRKPSLGPRFQQTWPHPCGGPSAMLDAGRLLGHLQRSILPILQTTEP